jgi:predicted enzyme related to lactoylglutathione lyase
MEYNPVNWFEIYVQDMTRAKRFYESLFGTTLVKLDTPDIEMWSFPMEVDRFGASGSLVKMEGFPSGGNSTIIYFNCNDCAVEAARVADAGGSLFKEKMSIGEYGFIALAFDTEGNMIGLHSMK